MVAGVRVAMRFVLLVLIGCVAPPDASPPELREVAIVRVEEGDTLSGIADRLAVPGDPSRWIGMHALVSAPLYDRDRFSIHELWLDP
jgi:hypothetical protein